MTHEELKAKALSKQNVKVEYDALALEFTLLREMLLARENAGLSQAEIAVRMGTKAPAITRLESSLTSGGSPYKSMQVDFYQWVTKIGATNRNLQVNAS